MTTESELVVVKGHKKPSEKLLSLIRGSVLNFKSFAEQAAEAVELGKKEGFTAKEVGDMIREEVLKAGLSIRTAQRYLPTEAKGKPRGAAISTTKTTRVKGHIDLLKREDITCRNCNSELFYVVVGKYRNNKRNGDATLVLQCHECESMMYGFELGWTSKK